MSITSEHFGQVPRSVLEDRELTPMAKLVYAALTLHLYGERRWIEQDGIASMLGCTRQCVVRAVEALKKGGHLSAERTSMGLRYVFERGEVKHVIGPSHVTVELHGNGKPCNRRVTSDVTVELHGKDGAYNERARGTGTAEGTTETTTPPIPPPPIKARKKPRKANQLGDPSTPGAEECIKAWEEHAKIPASVPRESCVRRCAWILTERREALATTYRTLGETPEAALLAITRHMAREWAPTYCSSPDDFLVRTGGHGPERWEKGAMRMMAGKKDRVKVGGPGWAPATSVKQSRNPEDYKLW